MGDTTILDLVQQSTERLVAEQLRSGSIVIARMEDLIAQAIRLGHSHASIHARILAGGLDLKWNSYRVALVRARQRARRIGSVNLVQTAVMASGSGAAAPVDPTSTAPRPPTDVLEALGSAKQVATRDYAGLARTLHRKKTHRP